MEQTQKPKSSIHLVVIVMLVATIALLAINQFAIAGLTQSVRLASVSTASSPTNAATAGTSAPTGSLAGVIPTGIPPVYGTELGVSYDDISASDPQKTDATIRKLATLDVNIKLEGEQLQRYIGIAGQMSCEYCCGAPSIIFTTDTGGRKAGDAACGCAHSYAMRGVAKYLITKHGTEVTDDQILEEMGKWKALFFPGPLSAKYDVMKQQGIDTNYVNLASNKYRDIEKGASNGGGMVGGC